MAQKREKSNLLNEARRVGSGVEVVEEGFARLTLRLPKNLWRAVKVYAAQNDTTIQGTIVELLTDFLKKKGINPEEFVGAGRGKVKRK